MALPTLDELLEGDLFELLGIKDADQEIKDQIVETMMRTIDARVLSRVGDLLSEEEAEEFKQLSETGDPQKLSQYLVDKKIDLPTIVSEEATRHRAEMIETIRLAQES